MADMPATEASVPGMETAVREVAEVRAAMADREAAGLGTVTGPREATPVKVEMVPTLEMATAARVVREETPARAGTARGTATRAAPALQWPLPALPPPTTTCGAMLRPRLAARPLPCLLPARHPSAAASGAMPRPLPVVRAPRWLVQVPAEASQVPAQSGATCQRQRRPPSSPTLALRRRRASPSWRWSLLHRLCW